MNDATTPIAGKALPGARLALVLLLTINFFNYVDRQVLAAFLAEAVLLAMAGGLVGLAIGAALGDWLSYWLGFVFKDQIAHCWPLSRHPDLLPKGEAFVRRFGVLAIAIGRFFGPLRASVPLVAGIFMMPWWHFQIANFASAFLWAAVLLAPGALGLHWLSA